MEFEQDLERAARLYSNEGYQTVVRPGPEDLPSFAKDFKVEIVGKRGDSGVLVSVKKNRLEMAADKEMPRYAEETASQPGWRYDLMILEPTEENAWQGRDAQEFSLEDIHRVLEESEQMVRAGFVRAAILSAWSAFEAAMRQRLRAEGSEAGWGTQPRQLISELSSSGDFDRDEYFQLERLDQLRNQIVHGFVSPPPDAGAVQFLVRLARRLVDESRPAKQIA